MNRVFSLILFLFILTLWEVFCRVSNISSIIIPAPSAVGLILWDGLTQGYLWIHIWVTTLEMTLGLVIGCSFGVLSGLLLSESVFLKKILWPYILASQVIPKLALGPIFIIWFGFGMTSTVTITALICYFPLLENTLTGVHYIPREKRELFRMLGATRLQTLILLKIPHGLPTILAGVRVSVVLALVGAVVGEFLSGQVGLGATIIAAQGMMDSALMFAVFIIITFIGLAFYQITSIIERWLLRRHNAGVFNANF
ncbi:MAG: ABC transporter permease [Rhodospirillaceae bacterium]|nr:ABC transporter permease [Rhodospirillaceae bacterium]|tara:strand:- start:5771 stop:6535 length:765 start_codon:yes stop_codon:yes gene_type:complete